MSDKIQIRRDTAATWTSVNPVLALGEIAYETDAHKIKVGDGATAWSSLGYIVSSASITGSDVTTALGYTPYNASNPSGYISGINSGMVTTALGYTPTSVTGLTGIQSVAAFKTGLSLVKADVGLGSVDNTADAAKNVLSATKLTTARTINGVSFDGTANIVINAVDSTARVPATRLINTTAPLTGGGDLSADRTLAISAASTVAAGSMSAADKTKLDAITGTNTGDQTITLTGPVTGSGTGSFATTITAGAVGLSQMANVATGTVFYRKTASTGAPEVQTLATLKTDLGLTGTNSGDQTTITGNAGTATALQTSRNFAISGSGITAAAVGFNGTANVTLAASVDAGHITLARMAPVASGTVFYRKTAASGDPEVQTLATLKTDLGLTGTNSGDQTITLSGDLSGTGTGAITTTLATVNSNVGSFGSSTLIPVITVNGKGLITAVSTVAPALTAGGSNTQVQYNSGGLLAGATNVAIDASGNLRLAHAAATTTPGTDQMVLEGQRIAASGGGGFIRHKTEDGTYFSVQAHIGRNNFMGFYPVTGNTTPTFVGMTWTNLGTATARTWAATNRLTRAKRLGMATTAASGSICGWLSPQLCCTTGGVSGGGFRAVFRWGASDAAAVAGANMFIGMQASTSNPSPTATPSGFTNCIGVAQNNGGTNLELVYGGSAAQTPIALGASFPAAGLSTDEYELVLYAWPSDQTKVAYRVENISTGAVASGLITAAVAGTQLPLNTTGLAPRMYRTNNATALAVAIDIVAFTLETDL